MAQWLPYLLVLACPVSMGVMMWVMMRGDHGHMGGSAPAPLPSSEADQRIAELESQVAELRAQVAGRDSHAAVSEPLGERAPAR